MKTCGTNQFIPELNIEKYNQHFHIKIEHLYAPTILSTSVKHSRPVARTTKLDPDQRTTELTNKHTFPKSEVSRAKYKKQK
jgi:hypothetical protein